MARSKTSPSSGWLARYSHTSAPWTWSKAVVAAAHCVEEVAPRLPVARPAEQLGHRRVRPGNVTPKQFADRGQLETAVVMLVKYAGRSQCPHQPIECQRVRVGRRRKLVAGFRTRRQVIGQSKGGGNMDRLADLEPQNEFERSALTSCVVM